MGPGTAHNGKAIRRNDLLQLLLQLNRWGNYLQPWTLQYRYLWKYDQSEKLGFRYTVQYSDSTFGKQSV